MQNFSVLSPVMHKKAPITPFVSRLGTYKDKQFEEKEHLYRQQAFGPNRVHYNRSTDHRNLS